MRKGRSVCPRGYRKNQDRLSMFFLRRRLNGLQRRFRSYIVMDAKGGGIRAAPMPSVRAVRVARKPVVSYYNNKRSHGHHPPHPHQVLDDEADSLTSTDTTSTPAPFWGN